MQERNGIDFHHVIHEVEFRRDFAIADGEIVLSHSSLAIWSVAVSFLTLTRFESERTYD